MAARTPNRARPHRKKKGNAKNKIGRKQNEGGVLDEFPLDRKHTYARVTDTIKGTRRQVNGIIVFTSGAFILHRHGDGLGRVSSHDGDAHQLPANGLVKPCRIFDESEFYRVGLSKEHSPMAQIKSLS
jgi:hypothetical protein